MRFGGRDEVRGRLAAQRRHDLVEALGMHISHLGHLQKRVIWTPLRWGEEVEDQLG